MSKANILTECAAAQCKTKKASHLLMCRPHWFALPENIKEAVYAGHRKMQDGYSARDWLIARERARLFIAVNFHLPDDVHDAIEAEIERLEGVKL